jgi:hypothetical protein
VNGADALSLSLKMPRLGAWHADLSISDWAQTDVSGAVEISVAGIVWSGRAIRSGSSAGITRARVVGGAGGFGRSVGPRAYQGVPLRLPVSDLLAEVGERLSPSADAGVLGQFLSKWTRMGGQAGQAFTAMLTAAASPAWRVLRDGSIWIGQESWPASQVTEWIPLAESPDIGFQEIYAEQPAVFPGETFDGRRVSLVELLVATNVRVRLWSGGVDG